MTCMGPVIDLNAFIAVAPCHTGVPGMAPIPHINYCDIGHEVWTGRSPSEVEFLKLFSQMIFDRTFDPASRNAFAGERTPFPMRISGIAEFLEKVIEMQNNAKKSFWS